MTNLKFRESIFYYASSRHNDIGTLRGTNRGLRQMGTSVPRAAASVAVGKAVARQELHVAPCIKTDGQ